jgi:stage III sporulation protein AE
MRKKFFWIFAAVFLSVASVLPVFASQAKEFEESKQVNEQLDAFDFSQINQKAGLNIKDLARKAIRGELNLSPAHIAEQAVQMLFHAFLDNVDLLRNLVLIGVLGAILQVLTDSFKNKSVGELGFYVTYLALTLIVLSSFQVTAGVMLSLVNNLGALMAVALPVMLGLLVVSGNVTSASTFNPIFVVVIEGVTLFIRGVLTPVLIMTAVLEIVNYISKKEVLTRFTKLIRKLADWSMKGIAILFLGVLSLQKISAPILNHFAVKAAKAGAGAIPVVGGLLSGAMDTVIYWSAALKSGVMAALVMGLIMVCSLPLLQILAVLLVYNVTAAVMLPLCDERIVKCLDGVGAFCTLLLSSGVTVVLMFIVSVVILLSI